MKKDLLKNLNIGRYIFLLLMIIAIVFLVFNEKGVLNYLKIKNEVSDINNKIKKVDLS